ncbi:NAD-P-binding protein [Calocera viscosa TUFC12733]|uniref:NAD-P-binding protein n=1 Tax=Calocera viscosa (strain TUFC12733) TaxID=1330018 RepID=A0A167IMD6_CALVF|nr:NAD-P-binding protein [Calocera viscosa TUFC12733]
MGQAFSEVFPPKTKWLPGDMPDMAGKVAIVTGGNTGIGKVTCKYLLLKDCTVYLFCRSASKAKIAIAELKAETGKDALFISSDLSDLASISASAKDFIAKEQRLDVLFASAGVMACPIELVTKQGYDMQFGTNVLGHAYLTLLLLPLLQETAKAHGSARVVTTTSAGHGQAPKGGFDYATLKDGPVRRKKYGAWTMYFQSKWGNVVFAKELQRRYGDGGITSTVVHPGLIRTEIARHKEGFIASLVMKFAYPADPFGAATQLWAGTAPETASFGGQYLTAFARLSKARPDTDSLEAGKALWEWIQAQLKGV